MKNKKIALAVAAAALCVSTLAIASCSLPGFGTGSVSTSVKPSVEASVEPSVQTSVSTSEAPAPVVKKYVISFNVNGATQTVVVEENQVTKVKIPVTEVKGKKQNGWKINNGGDPVLVGQTELTVTQAIALCGDSDGVTLFASYVDIAEISFVLEGKTTTYTLEEGSKNGAPVSEPAEDGFIFQGWAATKDATSALIKSGDEITYEKVKALRDENGKVTLYPVFEAEPAPETGITLYNYFTPQSLPEIRIATDGGIAIDDKSLIDPNQKKGMWGDVPVYNYVGAKVTTTNTDGFDLTDIAAQVKVRGNYTSTYAKKPIRIKFEKKQAMAGLNGGEKLKSWVLLAEWKDPSMLRNSLADYLGNCILESDGYYCSDFRFVKVYLNGKYNGIYVLAEQQQINKSRVNVPEAASAEDGVYNGYFIEYDSYYKNEPALQTFTLNYNSVKHADGSTVNLNTAQRSNKGYTVNNDIYSQAQHDYIAKCMQTIWNVAYDAMYGTHTNLMTQPYHTMDKDGNYIEDRTLTNGYDAISKVIDVQSLVDMYIIHEICQDYDIGYSSFYFSLDMSEGGNHLLTYLAPWDFDYGLGNNTSDGGSVKAMTGAIANQQKMIDEGRLVKTTTSGGGGWGGGWGGGTTTSYRFTDNAVLTEADFTFTNAENLYAGNANNPWLIICVQQKWFWEKVNAKWNQAKEAGVFTTAAKMIDDMATLYAKDFAENYAKWNNMGQKIDNGQPDIVTSFRNQAQAAVYLKAWLNARVAGLDKAFAAKLK